MAKKPYSPMATYSELKRVEAEINRAQTVEQIRKIVYKDGPAVGYKAFCYMLGGRMTPEAMKPDEACLTATTLEQEGRADEAMDIYKKVLELHPEHPLALSRADSQRST